MSKVSATYVPPPPPVQGVVTLSMPLEYARTLHLLCTCAGGEPEYSRRGHTDKVGEALAGALSVAGAKKLQSWNCINADNSYPFYLYFKNEEGI